MVDKAEAARRLKKDPEIYSRMGSLNKGKSVRKGFAVLGSEAAKKAGSLGGSRSSRKGIPNKKHLVDAEEFNKLEDE